VAEPKPAFWDTSALIPLCVQQKGSKTVEQLSAVYSIVAWWATPVEMRSALARLLRMGLLSPADHRQARERADVLRRTWREIQPQEAVRNLAASLVDQHPLRAADALQLASALIWSRQRPRASAFLAGDKQLLAAAESLGFQTIEI